MFFAMKKITLFSCVWNKRKKMRSVLLLVIILLCLNILLATFNATDGSISQDDEHLEINHLKKTAFYSIAGIYSALRNARNSHDFERNLVLEKHDEILRKIPVTHSKIQYFWDDRIFHQLHINLSDSKQQTNLFRNERLTYAAYEFEKRQKNILVYNGLDNWAIKQGSLVFKDMNCLHKNCHITSDRSTFQDVDVILFQSQLPEISKTRPNQLWLLYLLESPYNTPSFKNSQNLVNWTASYRLDSTIATPYEKYIPFNFSVLTRPATKNYAEGKTRQVAWFVSNCVTPNKRRQYVNELAQHITIDIYGACGAYRCQRSKSEDCFNMLNSRYKFYLAFENSNCKNYITEKFFINGLQHDVIPIVMGAPRQDYLRSAPTNSFIHVDDFESPKELATYLLHLDQNDTMYNEYFEWKGLWTTINTFFWCRLCSMSHEMSRQTPSWYKDIDKWWRGPDVCIGDGSWKKTIFKQQ